jgi:hypothetical protein
MTYKDVANSVSKFGGILFAPIRFTAVACYASGPMKVRLSFMSQNVPPPPTKPLHKHLHIRRHLVTAHFFQLTKRLCHCVLWLSLALRFTVGWNINTGLWGKNALLTRKVVSGVLYPYNSEKSNAQKSEIPTNIDVYSYRRAQRPASCSVGESVGVVR